MSAYTGFSLRIASSASQPLRGTICGIPAAATVRNGTFDTGLRTVSARARVTRPTARTSSPSPRPTQTGAPRRHARDSRASARARVGRVAVVLLHGAPAGPAVPCPDPQLEPAWALPVDADELERPAGRRRERPLAVQR